MEFTFYSRLRAYNFILGSTSPRRLQILNNNLNIDNITVIPSNFAENLNKKDYTVDGYVLETSRKKAEAIVQELRDKRQNSIILTSDTIILCNDQVFEKPKTKQKQLEMFLKYKLYGEILVKTAITVIKVDYDEVLKKNIYSEDSDLEVTKLYFDQNCSDELIAAYIESEEGLNVAGGFKFQELGCLLFTGILGDYYNIVGLPVPKTFQLLQKIV